VIHRYFATAAMEKSAAEDGGGLSAPKRRSNKRDKSVLNLDKYFIRIAKIV
jgi:hypothetical protein